MSAEESSGIALSDAIRFIPHGQDTVDFFNWAIYSLAVLSCVICCLVSSKYFAEEDYQRGKVALIGAGIAGAAPELAKLFLY